MMCQFFRRTIVVVLMLSMVVFRSSAMDPTISYYSTDIGEMRTIRLSDGSTIILNTDTRIRIEMARDERRIMLTRGEARFHVEKDPNRPFIVDTSHAVVRAVGTRFNVRVTDRDTAISVIEGLVRVDHRRRDLPWSSAPKSEPVLLHIGERALANSIGIIRDAGPSMTVVESWPVREIYVRNQPLIDLISELNRYHREQVRITDPALAAVLMNARLKSDNREAVVKAVQMDETLGVQVRRRPGGTIELRRRSH